MSNVHDEPTVEQIMEKLERLGLIYRTGKFREGEPVYKPTRLGKTIGPLDEDGGLATLRRMEKLGVVRRTGGLPEWELTDLGRAMNSSNRSTTPRRH